ncbi:MAG: hypothetical protein AAFW60_00945, partial [Pseudomonadota bacterium]
KARLEEDRFLRQIRQKQEQANAKFAKAMADIDDKAAHAKLISETKDPNPVTQIKARIALGWRAAKPKSRIGSKASKPSRRPPKDFEEEYYFAMLDAQEAGKIRDDIKSFNPVRKLRGYTKKALASR